MTCKFTNCTMQWADIFPESIGSNISIANNNIYVGTNQGNISFFTVYDSLGTIIYRENFQNNFQPITINADSSFFYTSSILKTDSGNNDILTRKYLNDFTSTVPRITNQNDIKVYPNPATKFININSGELRLKRISFFNLANQYLYSQELNSSDQTNTVVVPEFLKGELIYRTTDEKGRIYSGKLTLIR